MAPPPLLLLLLLLSNVLATAFFFFISLVTEEIEDIGGVVGAVGGAVKVIFHQLEKICPNFIFDIAFRL